MTPEHKHIAGLELLPCPFCGKEAELRQYDGDHFAQCLHCFCSTPADLGTKGEAAHAWNARAKAAPTELVDCACGDRYPANSYDAGFIHGSGMCANCDAALPARDIEAAPEPVHGEAERPIPIPTALMLWAWVDDESQPTQWHHGYESARGYVKAQIEGATPTFPGVAQSDPTKIVAWMLNCPTMSGDTGWMLSWSQSGAGVCNRLSGEHNEKPLMTVAQHRRIMAAAATKLETKGSRKALGAMNAKLRAKAGRLERELAAAKPDAELVELLSEAEPLIDLLRSEKIIRGDGNPLGMTISKCASLLDRIDAKLAELRKGEA